MFPIIPALLAPFNSDGFGGLQRFCQKGGAYAGNDNSWVVSGENNILTNINMLYIIMPAEAAAQY